MFEPLTLLNVLVFTTFPYSMGGQSKIKEHLQCPDILCLLIEKTLKAAFPDMTTTEVHSKVRIQYYEYRNKRKPAHAKVIYNIQMIVVTFQFT